MARQRRFELILVRQGTHASKIVTILEEAQKQQIPIKPITTAEMDAMAHGKTHGGLLAICSAKPIWQPQDLLVALDRLSRPYFFLLLEGVDDGQNLGFILRSAEAFGVQAVLLKKHLWDFDGGAVSRASSGAYERLPLVIFETAEELLPKLKRAGVSVYGCIANVKHTIYECDLTQSILVALGGEKRGLSAAIRKQCDRFIKIPMAVDVGSLSLSHAAAIILGETMRQRMQNALEELT